MCAVEWKSLEELGNFYGGLSGKSKEDFQDGNAKFVAYMNVYSNMSLDFTIVDMVKVGEDEKQNSIKYGDILFTGSSETPDDCGMSCVVTRHIDEPIYLNSFCFGFRFDDVEKFEPDFLKHYFRCIAMRKAISLTASGVTRFNVSKKRFGKIQIPLLAVSKQQEIVSHLDTFTTLISNLESELDMRRKQYEHYRNQLLDFEGVEGVEWKTLGEIGDVTKLAGFEFTEHVTYKEKGNIIALRGLNVRNGYLDLSDVKYIDGSNFEKLGRSRLYINDMLFTYVGTIGNVALISENDKFYLAPNVSRIRLNESFIKSRFALYYFQCFSFINSQINKYLNASSMKNLTMENIRKFLLPILPMPTQQEIVEKLDAFENLIQSLEQEIKLRKQQYEYYREKLLTFEKE